MSDFLDLVGMASLKGGDESSPEPEGSDELRWDAGQYLKFAGPRLQPGLDLVARITRFEPRTIVDLGCGTGDLTRLLAQRWPAARVTGVDRSEDMLAKADGTPEESEVEWVQGDISDWQPAEPVDLIFSNAALHWLPDHRTLFPRLVSSLSAEGVVAIQMPKSWDQPSHRLMREVLAEGDGGGPLGPRDLRQRLAGPPTLEAGDYLDLFSGCNCQADVWETEYTHVLEGRNPVLEWVRSTGLRPVLEGLEDRDRERFLELYRNRLREAYPRRSDDTTLFPFRRIFITAQRLRSRPAPKENP